MLQYFFFFWQNIPGFGHGSTFSVVTAMFW